MNRHSFTACVALSLLLLLLSLSSVSAADGGAAAAEQEFIVLDAPADLPPLPRHVLKWTVDDVQRWMTITIGYPELVPHIKAFLIDGPTLLALNVEKVFGSDSTASSSSNAAAAAAAVIHPAQLAKLKAHQQILRGQCACGGGAFSGSAVATSISAYLQNAGGSSLFHLALAAFAPRVGFLTLYFFDAPLMCCIFGSSVAAGDAAALEELERLYVAAGASSSSRSSSNNNRKVIEADTVYPCGMQSSPSNDLMCSRAPSWLLTLFALATPFGLFFWLGLGVFWSHPFLGSVWIFAFAVMQVIEVLHIVEFVFAVRERGFGAISIKEMVMEFFADFKNPLFLLVPAGLLVGRYGAAWMSYGLLLVLTGVVGYLLLRIVLNVVGGFLPKGGPGAGEGQQQQQQHDHEQDQSGRPHRS